MKLRRLACILLLALLILPAPARADVVIPGQKPPRNEQSEAFIKLYADSITAWDAAYDHAFDGVEELVLWRYPNSGQATGTADTGWFENGESLSNNFSDCYRDDQGRFWGYIGYIYGRRMSWVCLTDPSNADLPADPIVTEMVNKEVAAMLWRENLVPIFLVASVVTATGVLLYVFWYRKKRAK